MSNIKYGDLDIFWSDNSSLTKRTTVSINTFVEYQPDPFYNKKRKLFLFNGGANNSSTKEGILLHHFDTVAVVKSLHVWCDIQIGIKL